MKRAKGRGRKTSGSSSGRLTKKPVDMAAVREEIKNLVGNAAAGMVASGIEEANKGHYAAMKFLFELVGLYPAPEGAEQGEEKGGIARVLLGRLGVARSSDAEVTNVSPNAPAAATNAVE
jgi:hypothetical protein